MSYGNLTLCACLFWLLRHAFTDSKPGRSFAMLVVTEFYLLVSSLDYVLYESIVAADMVFRGEVIPQTHLLVRVEDTFRLDVLD